MRDFLNACDPYSFKLGALVRPEPVIVEPAPVLVNRQCVTPSDAKRVGYACGGLVEVSREWRNGVMVGATYGTARPVLEAVGEAVGHMFAGCAPYGDGHFLSGGFIGGSLAPMPSGVVEPPAFALTRSELTHIAESQAYWQAFDRGEPACSKSTEPQWDIRLTDGAIDFSAYC